MWLKCVSSAFIPCLCFLHLPSPVFALFPVFPALLFFGLSSLESSLDSLSGSSPSDSSESRAGLGDLSESDKRGSAWNFCLSRICECCYHPFFTWLPFLVRFLVWNFFLDFMCVDCFRSLHCSGPSWLFSVVTFLRFASCSLSARLDDLVVGPCVFSGSGGSLDRVTGRRAGVLSLFSGIAGSLSCFSAFSSDFFRSFTGFRMGFGKAVVTGKNSMLAVKMKRISHLSNAV